MRNRICKTLTVCILPLLANLTNADETRTETQPLRPDVHWDFSGYYALQQEDLVSGEYRIRVQPEHPDSRRFGYDLKRKGVHGKGYYCKQRASIQSNLTLPETFTLSFWLRLEPPATTEPVGVMSDEYEVATAKPKADDPKAIPAVISNLADWTGESFITYKRETFKIGKTEVDVPLDEWTHLVIIQTEQQRTVFMDGKKVTEATVTAKQHVPLSLLNGTYNTSLDEISVFMRALSDTEVAHLSKPQYLEQFSSQPEVKAGVDQTYWSDTPVDATLQATTQRADAIEWTLVSAPDDGTAQIKQPQQSNSTVTLSGYGKYTFKANATSRNGLRHSDRTSILIFPAQKTRQSKLYVPKSARTFPGGAAVTPLAYFPFEATGEAIDQSTNGKFQVDLRKFNKSKPTKQRKQKKPNNAKPAAVPAADVTITDQNGIRGSSLRYHGRSKGYRTTLGPILNGAKSGTVSSWVRPTTENSPFLLVGVEDQWELYVGGSLNWTACALGANAPAIPLPKDQWSHVILSWTSDAWRIFVNGSQVFYCKKDVVNANSDGNVFLNRSNAHKRLVGQIDEVAFYDFMINPAEAQLLHEKGVEEFTERLPYGEDYVYGYTEEYLQENMPKLKLDLSDPGFDASRVSAVGPAYEHPRIYFGPGDLPGIRRRLAETKAGRVAFAAAKEVAYQHLRDELDNPAKPLPLYIQKNADYNEKDRKSKPYTYHHKGYAAAYVVEAFRCVVENDEAMAERLVDMQDRQADLQLEWRERFPAKINGPNFQSATHNFLGRRTTGILYDLLYHWMTEEQRDKIRRVIAIGVNDKWATGLDGLHGQRGHNWACWIAGDLMINAMAVEGEDHSDPTVVKRCVDFYKRFLFTTAGPRDGSPWPGLAKHSVTAGKILAASRRGGEPLIAASTLINHVRHYTRHCLQPFGPYQIKDDLHGGSLKTARLTDVSVIKYVYPNDKVVDYAYHQATGNDYEHHNVSQSVYTYNSNIERLVTADDYFGPEDLTEHAEEALKGLGTSQLFNYNNTFSARTSWDQDAMLLWFWPRMLGGHPIPARGTFVLSALGREWAQYPHYPAHTFSRYHSIVQVDGEDPGVEWGRVIAHHETPLVSSVTSDLVCPYSRQMPEFLPQNWFRLEKEEEPWEDVPRAKIPNWLHGNFPMHPLLDDDKDVDLNWRPDNFDFAYRSATLVRGDHPYALIVDDFKKDDELREWTWQLALGGGLGTDVRHNGAQLPRSTYKWENVGNRKQNEITPIAENYQKLEAASHHDVIVAEPGTRRRLLIRMFRVNAPSLTVKSPCLRMDKNGKKAIGNYRVVYKIKDASARFATILYPFLEGEPLPSFTLNEGIYELKWQDQADTIRLSKNNGPTSIKIRRNGESILPQSPGQPR